MGFRFTKRIKVLPGITLNVSKSGLSTTIGPRGAKVTVGGKRGPRATFGIPGTGLSHSQRIGDVAGAQPTTDASGKRGGSRVFWLFILLLAALGAFMALTALLGL